MPPAKQTHYHLLLYSGHWTKVLYFYRLSVNVQTVERPDQIIHNKYVDWMKSIMMIWTILAFLLSPMTSMILMHATIILNSRILYGSLAGYGQCVTQL